MKVYNKLVRDKIPEIIIADGKKPIIRILDNDEYLQELDKKLNEEIAEYQADKSVEEMADVLEVLFAICEARGHSVEELMEVRDAKREKRGGFEQKIWARAILYNFSSSITANVTVDREDCAYEYQINYSSALKTCRDFLRIHDETTTINVEGLIVQNIEPIRPGRSFARQHRFKLPMSFCYRN